MKIQIGGKSKVESLGLMDLLDVAVGRVSVSSACVVPNAT
jgi:hypothetical protein